MTDEQMNVAVAELCGIKVCRHPLKFGGPPCCDGVSNPKSYCTSLDAMREAREAVLVTDEMRRAYIVALDRSCNADFSYALEDYRDMSYRLANATARQQAEALLAVCGKEKMEVQP